MCSRKQTKDREMSVFSLLSFQPFEAGYDDPMVSSVVSHPKVKERIRKRAEKFDFMCKCRMSEETVQRKKRNVLSSFSDGDNRCIS